MLVKTKNSSLPSLNPESLLAKLSNGQELLEEEVSGVLSILATVKEVKLFSKSFVLNSQSSKHLNSELLNPASLQLGADSLSLKELPGVDEVYCLIKIIGQLKLSSHSDLIDTFLFDSDALTVVLVLEILCLEWGKTEDYLEQVVSFALGSSVDEDGDISATSIRILGEYLREAEKNKAAPEKVVQIKKLLLDILVDEANDSLVRKASYFSMMRSLGKDWTEIPSECVQFDFSKEESLYGSSNLSFEKKIDWSLVDSFTESG